MKQLILGVILLFPTVGLAQEVRNEKGICYRTIAGLGTYQAPADTATILIQCFDAALAQCALEDTFTDCLEASTGSFMAALEIGRNSFDQSTLQTALPGRRYAWIDFETSF
ncbi:MAG: hypothetical protein P8L32_00085, partial [Paracoccaceae bacterium]|nr:hypothetical protein [Paracoccaceae bacterium]